MRVALAADHAGHVLKLRLVEAVAALGHEIIDLGTRDERPVDYPDYAEAVGRAILSGDAERGILVCGSGVARRSRPTSSPAFAPASVTTATRPAKPSSTTT